MTLNILCISYDFLTISPQFVGHHTRHAADQHLVRSMKREYLLFLMLHGQRLRTSPLFQHHKRIAGSPSVERAPSVSAGERAPSVERAPSFPPVDGDRGGTALQEMQEMQSDAAGLGFLEDARSLNAAVDENHSDQSVMVITFSTQNCAQAGSQSTRPLPHMNLNVSERLICAFLSLSRSTDHVTGQKNKTVTSGARRDLGNMRRWRTMSLSPRRRHRGPLHWTRCKACRYQ